ncbi:NAD-dependent epimerase [Pseudomonas guariconensis]|uniref:NAD-dependent epimerase n=1 Tax=Pseudomonas TaxID=286 RepID=UPI001CE423F9|nr:MULTISPECIES: NAD-dependent epimerase [Pseudomonas]MCO7642695.1 NAD-dependent epimerase [Pseudomonas sp. S 311-6]MCO7517018.1 NAD-dependent epimerase [Pseudomonas putida]MCO7564120.1 NAD-dependent epimerase [Pseudomonas mosselii]MCO7593990.1 NAD-dependent epimerase [Pseudomonas guariconensis]MCO7607365.1 NAD-dependent epimerase [Pseudomonas guariconensis]
MKVLVTGAAGFIGAHTCLRLLRDGHQVVGLDNFNDYYDPAIKHARVLWVRQQGGDFNLRHLDLSDRDGMARLFAMERPEVVVHLAAQAGVRHSLQNPQAYIDSNLVGFLNILEGCRRHPVQHLLYASSSSVYGANRQTPYRVQDTVDHPLSLYAATKKANEAMAHSYSHLFGIPCSGLRFFTVYGPWGRPDMSPMQFAKAISEGRPIQLFNHGRHQRDFTYIDDIVESLVRLMPRAPAGDPDWNPHAPDPASSQAPWRLYNIGGQRPVELLDYLALLEKHLQRNAVIELLPLQPGDVLATCADASALARVTGFTPQVSLDEGLRRFIAWFQEYCAPNATTTTPAGEQADQRRAV